MRAKEDASGEMAASSRPRAAAGRPQIRPLANRKARTLPVLGTTASTARFNPSAHIKSVCCCADKRALNNRGRIFFSNHMPSAMISTGVARAGVAARQFSTGAVLRAENSRAAAAKMTKEQEKAKKVKEEAKKDVKRKRKFHVKPENQDLYLPVPEALRYIRAFEVGRRQRPIMLQTRVYASKGVVPIKGEVRLPHLLTETKIAVFTLDPAVQAAALAKGAVVAGGEELVAAVLDGLQPINFHKALATAEMLVPLRKAARTLGPRGLMPSQKTKTVIEASEELLEAAIKSAGGALLFRQKNESLTLPVAHTGLLQRQVLENIVAVKKAITELVAKTDSRKTCLVYPPRIVSHNLPGFFIDWS